LCPCLGFIASLRLNLLMKCPHHDVISGVCPNSFVAQGFQSVEHQIRGLSDRDCEAIALCAQVHHYSVKVCELALVNMAVNERWVPKCHFPSWALAKTAYYDIRHGSYFQTAKMTLMFSIIYTTLYTTVMLVA